MRMRAIAALGAGLVLVVGALAAQAAPSIDLFGSNPDTGLTDFGICQDAVAPRGLPMNISCFAKLGGLAGISGAEFFIRERGPTGQDIRVFESTASGGLGWSAAVFPNGLATAVLGSPFQPTGSSPDITRRYNISFGVTGPNPSDGCQVGDADAPPGYIRLFDASISKSTLGGAIPPDTYMWVGPGDPPSNPQQPWVLFRLCDAPIYTAVQVEGGQFIINPSTRTCTVAVQQKAWSAVKELYR